MFTLLKYISSTILLTAIVNISFSQNCKPVLLNDSIKKEIISVYEEYKKDTKYVNSKVITIEYWNYLSNDYYNPNDTNYYSISVTPYLSYICFRLPTSYVIYNDVILLINTGIEEIIRPNPIWLKELFTLIGNKVEKNVEINSYEDFEYTYLKNENEIAQLDGDLKTNIYKVKSGKIVKSLSDVGGQHYMPVLYKHHSNKK